MSTQILKCQYCKAPIDITEVDKNGCCHCEYCGAVFKMTGDWDLQQKKVVALNRGNDFLRLGDYDSAYDEFNRVIHMDNTDAEAHWGCFLSRFGIEIVEDPNTMEYVPTCHRASADSVFDDLDYQAAISFSEGVLQRRYKKDGLKIAEVLQRIWEMVLRVEPFDIFICYKQSEEDGTETQESRYAEDIYKHLQGQSYKVFFARETLKDKPGTEYEPFIYAALHSARVMLVIGTTEDHLNAGWVKNEWGRFITLKRETPEKMIIPCFRDMRAEDLPTRLRPFQSYDMADLSFMANLISALRQIINPESNLQPEKASTSTSNLQNLVERMKRFFHDKNFDKAMEYSERILDIDVDNWEAYLIQLMIECGATSEEGLQYANHYLTDFSSFSHAVEFAPEDVKKRLLNYIEAQKKWQIKRMKQYLSSKQFGRAKECSEIILAFDNQNWEAYLVQLMLECGVSSEEELKYCEKELWTYQSYQNAVRYAPEMVKTRLIGHKKAQIICQEIRRIDEQRFYTETLYNDKCVQRHKWQSKLTDAKINLDVETSKYNRQKNGITALLYISIILIALSIVLYFCLGFGAGDMLGVAYVLFVTLTILCITFVLVLSGALIGSKSDVDKSNDIYANRKHQDDDLAAEIEILSQKINAYNEQISRHVVDGQKYGGIALNKIKSHKAEANISISSANDSIPQGVPVVNMLYYGKVVRILKFGAFVEIMTGKEGMVHITKLANHPIGRVEDAINLGDMIWVKVTDIDAQGRIMLSHIDAVREIEARKEKR